MLNTQEEMVTLPMSLVERILANVQENTESNKQNKELFQRMLAMMESSSRKAPRLKANRKDGSISDLTGNDTGSTDSEASAGTPSKFVFNEASPTYVYQNILKQNNIEWRRSKNSDLSS